VRKLVVAMAALMAFAGGLWGSSDKCIVRTPGGDFYGQSLGGHDLDGFVGGVQAGCDYQFGGGLVVGVAGDYERQSPQRPRV
jgi:hypothetical protein